MGDSNLAILSGGPIALGLFTLSLAFFFYLGFMSRNDAENSDSFWFDGRGLHLRRQYFTWFAATVAFSSAVLYYMQITAVWGWWVYIGSIGTYVCGQLIAIAVVRHSAFDLTKFSTVGKFVESRSGSHMVGWMVDCINAIALFSLVYIEIGLGVKIFSALFDRVSFAFELLAFLALGLVPFLYIRMGGFRAIVESDLWQSILIILGLLALAVFILLYRGDVSIFSSEVLLPPPAEGVGLSEIAPYLLFAMAINLLISIPQISIWQRLASAREGSTRYRLATVAVLSAGLVFAIYVTIAGWYILTIGPIISPADVLRPIQEAGPFAQDVLFPLVFVGMLAALISSADSSAMAGIQSIAGRTRIEDPIVWRAQRKKAIRVLGVALASIFVLHIIIEFIGTGFLSIFLTVIFYLFSQIALVAPIVIICAFWPRFMREGPVAIFGLAVAWILQTLGYLFPQALVLAIPHLGDIYSNQYVGGMMTTLVTIGLVIFASVRWSPRKLGESD